VSKLTPMAPKKPCNQSGCAALVNRKERFCAAHKAARWKEQDKRREKTTARGYGGNHRRLRKLVMAEQPLCPVCQAEGIIKEATEMDHIDGNAHNLERSNLQMLCARHHRIKTNREQGGFGRPKKEQ